MSQLVASRAFFVESGTYQQPVLRTYKTNFNSEIVNDYLTATENGTQIVPAAMSNISNAILSPTAQIDGYVGIENGWEERRMTFVMEVLVPDRFGGIPRTVVLVGYTNHTDVSPISKVFDPNMRLYFNTSTVLTTITHRHPTMGIINRKCMMDSSHLLNRSVVENILGNNQLNNAYVNQELWYATPRNVIYEMHNQLGASEGVYTPTNQDFRVQGNKLSIDRSRRDNAVPTSYLSKILKGVSTANAALSTGISVDEMDGLTNASQTVKEERLDIDGVMLELNTFDNGFFMHAGYITWGQLQRMIPNIDSVTTFSMRASAVVQTNVPDAVSGNFSHWSGANAETLIANRVSQLIPAIMTSSLLGTLSFVFSNDNITMEPMLSITSAQPLIEGLDFSQLANQFQARFLSEVAPAVTDQNRTLINMIVQCGLGTETYISISRNGEPEVPFCAPTFCDALYTPILSPSQNQLTAIASDLHNIAVSSNLAQMQPQWNMNH